MEPFYTRKKESLVQLSMPNLAPISEVKNMVKYSGRNSSRFSVSGDGIKRSRWNMAKKSTPWVHCHMQNLALIGEWMGRYRSPQILKFWQICVFRQFFLPHKMKPFLPHCPHFPLSTSPFSSPLIPFLPSLPFFPSFHPSYSLPSPHLPSPIPSLPLSLCYDAIPNTRTMTCIAIVTTNGLM